MSGNRERQSSGDEDGVHPLVAGLAKACGYALGAVLIAKYNSPENQRLRKKQQERERRARAENLRDVERRKLRHRLQESYFADGPGKALYDERAHVVFPARNPFPDGTFERVSGGYFGGPGLIAASASAGASLTAKSDDGRGDYRLVRPDGTSRTGGVAFTGDMIEFSAQEHIPASKQDWELMARLIAAPNSFCRRIRVRRADHQRIRDLIWHEYLQEHPDIAAAIGDS